MLRVPSPQAERLVRNESVLDTAQSQRVALQLHNATRHTAAYFGSDVRLAYRLAARLLQHESAQRGFRLAATQDVHFTEVWGRWGDPPWGGWWSGVMEWGAQCPVSGTDDGHVLGDPRGGGWRWAPGEVGMPGTNGVPLCAPFCGVQSPGATVVGPDAVVRGTEQPCPSPEPAAGGQRAAGCQQQTALGADPADGGRHGVAAEAL